MGIFDRIRLHSSLLMGIANKGKAGSRQLASSVMKRREEIFGRRSGTDSDSSSLVWEVEEIGVCLL